MRSEAKRVGHDEGKENEEKKEAKAIWPVEVSFYVQKSSHIYEGCINCLVRVLQATEEKKKS